MIRKIKFLILALCLIPRIANGCRLDQNFNYFFDSLMTKQLLERLGFFHDGHNAYILNGLKLPNVYFLPVTAPSPEIEGEHIIHRTGKGSDIFNNTWSALLTLESYLKDCSEPLYRLMYSIHNMRQPFKKLGDIKSKIEFVSGDLIDEHNFEEFQRKFNTILEKYGLQSNFEKNTFKIIITINRIVRNDGKRLQYFNYVKSTSKSIHYSYSTTDINNEDFRSFESLLYLVSSINSKLPIRFRHGNNLGWGKSLFQYLDPFSEYDIGIFISSLTLLFILSYAAVNFREIKYAWTRSS